MRSDVATRGWTAVVFITVFASGLLVFLLSGQFLPAESAAFIQGLRSTSLPVIVLIFLVPALAAAGLFHLFVNRYIKPVEQLSDAATFLGHPAGMPEQTPSGIGFIDRISVQMEQASERLIKQQDELREQIGRASIRLARERDTLATIIEQLRQGIIVTNERGQILLYNGSAADLFRSRENSTPVWLGIGRSLEELMEPAMVRFALQECRGNANTDIFRFMARCGDDRLLRVKAMPASLKDDQKAGVVFFLHDVTRSVSDQNQAGEFMDDGLRKIRDALGGIRAATDNLKTYPDADESMKQQFYELILIESGKIAELVGARQKEQESAHSGNTGLRLLTCGQLFGLAKRMADTDSPKIVFQDPEESVHIRADGFALALVIIYLCRHLRAYSDAPITIKALKFPPYVQLQICWRGREPKPDEISSWLEKNPMYGELEVPYPVDAVFKQHQAEHWIKQEDEEIRLNIILPEVEEVPRAVSGPSRGHYDFDLFGATTDLAIAERPLESLTATVFDTETTGLYPSDGDRLISVGAVRIVNGSLQDDQIFHELIHPGRSIPTASTEIHGITDEMVSGKPDAKQCLADFHRFCGDDPLIAHNAAFDMRFLELEQKRAYVDFTRPVIDTLLLSTILHPNLEGHSLDDLAGRFDIRMETRHQALGDAVMTARIFLQMIPLLAEMNIYTVGDALSAGRESKYARVKY